MLKIQNITYPITFISNGVGRFTFSSRYCGLKNGGVAYRGSVDHFVQQHNHHNPENSPSKDYFFYNKEYARPLIGLMNIGNVEMRSGATTTTTCGVCKVEQMPLGAKLKGVLMESGEWVDILVKPVRIEVDGDTITFLLHHTFKSGGFSGEVSMKRGTTIKWSE